MVFLGITSSRIERPLNDSCGDSKVAAIHLLHTVFGWTEGKDRMLDQMHSRKMQSVTPLFTAAILVAGLLVIGGCQPEPYGSCSLPRSSVLDQACKTQTTTGEGEQANTESKRNCVVDFVFECESRLCATYAGNSPFCTERCSDAKGNNDGTIDQYDDASCPDGGACVEFVPGTGDFYCIPPSLAKETDFTPKP